MKDRPHSRLWVPEKQATTDAHELPTETFKNCLTSHIFRKLLDRVVPVAITLDSKPSSATFDYEINPVISSAPLRMHAIAGLLEAMHYLQLEFGLCAFFRLFTGPVDCPGILSMFN